MAEWYYHKGERTLGPVQETSINAWIETGFLAPDDFVWAEGMSGWTLVSDFDPSVPSLSASPSSLPEPIGAKPTSRVHTIYAAFHWRALALFVDSFIIGSLLTIFFYDRLQGLDPAAIMEDRMFSVTAIVASIVYHSLWEASLWQASPGKRLCRLQVVALDGSRLSLPRAALRQLGKLASQILLLGYLMALFTPRRQALHDWLARCLVVRRL